MYDGFAPDCGRMPKVPFARKLTVVLSRHQGTLTVGLVRLIQDASASGARYAKDHAIQLYLSGPAIFETNAPTVFTPPAPASRGAPWSNLSPPRAPVICSRQCHRFDLMCAHR